MKTKTNALTITILLALSAIAPVALGAGDSTPHPVPTAVGNGQNFVFANGTHLLNGRYSFRANGNLNNDPSPYAGNGPICRVGTIVFDGVGNVSGIYFYETVDGHSFKLGGSGGLNDGWVFASGTYEVQNNSLGKVHLRFTSTYEIVPNWPITSERIEHWDIALTGGGKAFFLANHSDLDKYEGTDPVWGTVSGEARAE